MANTDYLLTHGIGTHIKKEKTLAATIEGIDDVERPWQVFLSAPLNTALSTTDADLTASAAAVAATGVRLFVHAPYIINLAGPKHCELLKKTLRAADAAACCGVVVHVGKATKQTPAAALAVMRQCLTDCLVAATPTCPLLLETPAGQGTELLTAQTDFLAFVRSFGEAVAQRRFGICADTCHVFAAGVQPIDYLRRCHTEAPGLVRLVHFNDSQNELGSCLDRHAFVGTGAIGLAGMTEVANFCNAHDIPMVVE